MCNPLNLLEKNSPVFVGTPYYVSNGEIGDINVFEKLMNLSNELTEGSREEMAKFTGTYSEYFLKRYFFTISECWF